MNFYDPLKNILKRGAESEKYKYSLIISAVTMVHICLVAFFLTFTVMTPHSPD